MPPPVAGVVAIPPASRSPIAGRPQIAHFRWPRPRTRHPVVAFGSVAPIAGCPQIPVPGAIRLRILRQRWRRIGCLHRRFPVVCILIFRIVVVVGILAIPVLRIIPARFAPLACAARGSWRGRRRAGWLGIAGRCQVRRRGRVRLRLIRLRRLILGAVIGRLILVARGKPQRHCDASNCHKDRGVELVSHFFHRLLVIFRILDAEFVMIVRTKKSRS